jgi:hypothetical protein
VAVVVPHHSLLAAMVVVVVAVPGIRPPAEPVLLFRVIRAAMATLRILVALGVAVKVRLVASLVGQPVSTAALALTGFMPGEKPSLLALLFRVLDILVAVAVVAETHSTLALVALAVVAMARLTVTPQPTEQSTPVVAVAVQSSGHPATEEAE